jgi:hypothetical protein
LLLGIGTIIEGSDHLSNPLRRTILSDIIFLLLFLFQLNPVSAQDDLSDSEIQDRLLYIYQRLGQGESNARRWWTGWLIGYSAATIAQGAIGLTSKDEDTQQDMALGAATTFLGTMGQIISPMTPGSATDQLSRIPESTSAERKEKLIKAEKLLQSCALREKDGRSWKTHTVTGAVNLCSGCVVWLAFDRSPLEGFINFIINMVITEFQIWTQPTQAIDSYYDYVDKYKTVQKIGCIKPEKAWSVAIYPGGIGIKIVL